MPKELRPYQAQGIKDLSRSVARYRRSILVMPTGSGKTFTSCEIIKRMEAKGWRGLVLAHRAELISQWVDTLSKMGIQAGAIKAGIESQPHLKVQVASIQTLIRRELPPNIRWIFIDEAHRTMANSYLKVLENYPKAYVIGVTATPVRTDGKGLGDLFNDMVVPTSKQELIKMGYLVPSKVLSTPLNSALLGRRRRGEYSNKELEEISSMLSSGEMMGDLYGNWAKARTENGLRTICFAGSVQQSKIICDMYRDKGISSAHIDGNTKTEERKRILKDFAEGRVEHVTNVGVLTEGYDNPGIECVQLVRPTKSYGLYNQMVGRGARPAPGKRFYYLLDYGNNMYEHDPPDFDPEWSLDKGKVDHNKPEEKSYKVKMKKKDGGEQLVVLTREELESMQARVELVEIDTTFRKDRIDQALYGAEMYGYSRSAAWYTFVEYLKKDNLTPSLPELHYFKKKLGYHGGWVKHKAKELGIMTL